MKGKREGRRDGLNTSGKVLIVLGVFLLAFVVCMIVIFCVKGMVPDTLIQCVLGSGGLECAALAGIKISKIISGQKSGERNADEGPFV